MHNLLSTDQLLWRRCRRITLFASVSVMESLIHSVDLILYQVTGIDRYRLMLFTSAFYRRLPGPCLSTFTGDHIICVRVLDRGPLGCVLAAHVRGRVQSVNTGLVEARRIRLHDTTALGSLQTARVEPSRARNVGI